MLVKRIMIFNSVLCFTIFIKQVNSHLRKPEEKGTVPPPPWDLFDDCCAAKTAIGACNMYSYECNPCISPYSCCTNDDDDDYDPYDCKNKKQECAELNAWIDQWCHSGEIIPPVYAPPWN